MPAHTQCRICRTPLPEPFLNLGSMPLANAFLRSPEEFKTEASYPLAVSLCPGCGLVQLTVVVPPEQMYRQYPYVSSTSESVRRYASDLARRVVGQLELSPADCVVELGSNDGLVLKAFQNEGTRVLGVEPACNIAAVARSNGIPTVEEFFDSKTASAVAREEGRASVLLGRHVFAHIDDVHDFFVAADQLLTADGVLLIEVPYLGNLFRQMEFDTIYHEHLSYIGLRPVMVLAHEHGFRLTDVEPVPLHGGSVLLWIQRGQNARPPTERLQALWEEEKKMQLEKAATWAGFARGVAEWKNSFEQFIDRLSEDGAHWIGYGAAAKANTLLNFCPSVAQQMTAILDRNPLKQGFYTPGTHIPVRQADAWRQNGVNHMLILAWNFRDEIIAQMKPFAAAGGRFAVPIPRPQLI